MQRLVHNELSRNIVCKLPVSTAGRLAHLARLTGVTQSDVLRSALTAYMLLLALGKEEDGKRS